MKHFKPDMNILNIFLLILGTIYLAILFNDHMTLRKNIKLEEHIEEIGGNLEANGKELNYYYAKVQEETRKLPNDDIAKLESTSLKYTATKWLILAIFSYIVAGIVIREMNKDTKT